MSRRRSLSSRLLRAKTVLLDRALGRAGVWRRLWRYSYGIPPHTPLSPLRPRACLDRPTRRRLRLRAYPIRHRP
jgi:hypothetical protein